LASFYATSPMHVLTNDTFHSFDLDLPLEVDDEYWESRDDPRETFKQPPGVPSLVSSFTQVIRLSQIIAFALKTLVRIMSLSNKSYLTFRTVRN
jgi:hypothetical protein